MQAGEVHIKCHYDEHGTETIEVTRADAWTTVADELYRAVANQASFGIWKLTIPNAEAGEGILVLNAINGTFRYALREFLPLEKSWTAQRLFS